MTSYQERMKIHEICTEYEWEHFPEILVLVEPGLMKGRWVIHMGATGFSSDGKFSKEVSKVVIFGQKQLRERVREMLDGMYCELYDS